MSGVRPWIALIYHDVTPHAPAVTGGRDFFSVSAASFDRQLAIIQELGLRGRSIADALAQPAETVAITFDDGDLGQAVRAFPALAARNMTATFFVTTSWVGTASYASWDQLREMRAAGMSIQSHTHTHPFLSELDGARLRDELRRSREILDEQLQQRTTMIAFPGGDAPRPELRSLLAETGYEVVGTSRWGRNGSTARARPLYVKRCTVRGAPSDAAFAAIVTGNRWLNLKKQTRERVLAFLRASLGPSRYARWRRSVLNAAGTSEGAVESP
ncbi:MAG: polysaccharide deacetylase family protein [Gemmatimonadaceae bacterium]